MFFIHYSILNNLDNLKNKHFCANKSIIPNLYTNLTQVRNLQILKKKEKINIECLKYLIFDLN